MVNTKFNTKFNTKQTAICSFSARRRTSHHDANARAERLALLHAVRGEHRATGLIPRRYLRHKRQWCGGVCTYMYAGMTSRLGPTDLLDDVGTSRHDAEDIWMHVIREASARA